MNDKDPMRLVESVKALSSVIADIDAHAKKLLYLTNQLADLDDRRRKGFSGLKALDMTNGQTFHIGHDTIGDKYKPFSDKISDLVREMLAAKIEDTYALIQEKKNKL
jgi:hypothetical protein